MAFDNKPSPARSGPAGQAALGAYGERLAARCLTGLGMQIIETNWRVATGEIDIIARDGDCLVICEVKTRRHTRAGSPVEAVTPEKLARLRRLAGQYLATLSAKPQHIRIDVVAITVPRQGPPQLVHLVAVD